MSVSTTDWSTWVTTISHVEEEEGLIVFVLEWIRAEVYRGLTAEATTPPDVSHLRKQIRATREKWYDVCDCDSTLILIIDAYQCTGVQSALWLSVPQRVQTELLLDASVAICRSLYL